MNTQGQQRGIALIMALGIMALFLAVGILLLTMTTQNSQNFGNAYQKQRYYDVAEAGIDRGLRDINSVLPSPGATGYLTATPAPPATPSADQTPLPNVPNVPYYYSYWYNASSTPTSTPDPLGGTFGVSTPHPVNVPAHGAVIWSHTTVGVRDVAVEVIVSRFSTSTTSCAICAGGSAGATGSTNVTQPATGCGSNPKYKICADPLASPPPGPTAVPIVAGGSYTCNKSPCTYGEGNTPNPITQNAPPGSTSGFLASQGTIDQLSNAAAWQAAANGSSIRFIDCGGSTCSASQYTGTNAPQAGQIAFVNGSIDYSTKAVNSYGGQYIVSNCFSVNQPGFKGTSATAGVTVLGTDAQCSGSAMSFSGGGNTKEPLWDGGTAYAVRGSISIAGNGSVRAYSFYGAAIAANDVIVSGNGLFAWESSLATQGLVFGPYAIDSFTQY
ncbi:MAG: hypothetical protein DLM53_05265 [Candidatus Eremiobacter antarcticus]|nr:pilus assembly PilX N-terminal domain-containing protein [Candidatus Eremiobacteraeota bacterium]MBC5807057.1 pilus assembly PilX N-terminal domain-containing protein [Candidatus Eremiobacteraeota bacterium]PZR62815.1 MAG: hypothetical protein DLM53_05265 [Candidatus Eremiobacter sp. RRmetagenome_bin22]